MLCSVEYAHLGRDDATRRMGTQLGRWFGDPGPLAVRRGRTARRGERGARS